MRAIEATSHQVVPVWIGANSTLVLISVVMVPGSG
jgi:hypothetical protein